MTERHLKVVERAPYAVRADQEAVAILTEHGMPQSYASTQNLLSIAYLQGMRAGLDIGERIALGDGAA